MMNALHNVTMTAVFFGVLIVACRPVLADTAAHGDAPSVFAQLKGQQEEKATSNQPADQTPAMDPQRMGTGMMGGGDGMMNPQMRMRMMQMHQDMMGLPAMQEGMRGGMGPCPMMARADKDLSPEQVRDILEGQIAWTGNKRLKVGSVEQKDEETYVAEIMTVDDSLVQRLEVNRSTGAMRPTD